MRTTKLVAWSAVFALVWTASRTWGYQDPAAPEGLTGILPAFAPDDLSEGYFSGLGEGIDATWKDWVTETAGLVKDFYEGQHPTVPQQRESLDRLKTKLATLETVLADPRYSMLHPRLAQLYGRLDSQVTIADAILNTLTLDPQTGRRAQIEAALVPLRGSLDALRRDMRSFRGGENWLAWVNADQLATIAPDAPDLPDLVNRTKHNLERRDTYPPEVRDFVSRPSMLAVEEQLAALQSLLQPLPAGGNAELRAGLVTLIERLGEYRDTPSAEREAAIRQQLDQLQTLAPDGGALLVEALASQFQNYNLRLFVSEGLMNRFFTETRRESSQINDRMMEATIRGHQTTDVVSRVDLLPYPDKAFFAVRLSGMIHTNTSGFTSQATVRSVGTHRFTAAKGVLFDGHVFQPGRSRVAVLPSIRNVGVNTKFSNIPLLGGIANNIAMGEANKRIGQANAITRNKVAQQVGDELDAEAATEFANASRDLEANTYGPLRKYGLYPETMAVCSSDTLLYLSTRLMAADEVAGSRPAPIAGVPPTGMIAQIHESALTNGMDSIGLQGKMSEAEVNALLESRLSEILGREVDLPDSGATSPEDAANLFIFDERDPVRFTIDDGAVVLHIRAALERANGEIIPTQIISVPLGMTLAGDKIAITRSGSVRVIPVERVTDARTQITRAQIMRQKIQSALPDREIDAVMDVENKGKTVQLRVTSLTAAAGWLTVTLE